MNNTFVIIIASLGGVLWLIAVLRERFKNSTSAAFGTLVKSLFPAKETANVTTVESSGDAPTGSEITIDALERELGIEPDHYLCDRIARINEALVARRDKTPSKKKGGAQ